MRPRRIKNNLYNFDDGTDSQNGYTDSENVIASKNWLMNQISKRRDQFINSSLGDDLKRDLMYAKSYDDFYTDNYEQYDKELFGKQYDINRYNTKWMDKKTKKAFDQFISSGNKTMLDVDDFLYSYINNNYYDPNDINNSKNLEYFDKMKESLSDYNINRDQYIAQLRLKRYSEYKSNIFQQGLDYIKNAQVYDVTDPNTKYFGNASREDGIKRLGLDRNITGINAGVSLLEEPIIYMNGFDDISSLEHELNHLFQRAINNTIENSNYWNRWNEKHSRGKLVLKEINYDGRTIDKDYLDTIKEQLRKHKLDLYQDDELIDILNFANYNNNNNQDVIMADLGKSPGLFPRTRLDVSKYDEGKMLPEFLVTAPLKVNPRAAKKYLEMNPYSKFDLFELPSFDELIQYELLKYNPNAFIPKQKIHPIYGNRMFNCGKSR